MVALSLRFTNAPPVNSATKLLCIGPKYLHVSLKDGVDPSQAAVGGMARELDDEGLCNEGQAEIRDLGFWQVEHTPE